MFYTQNFHQSPAWHSDYMMTGQWRCSRCWQLLAARWLHSWLTVSLCCRQFKTTVTTKCTATVWSPRSHCTGCAASIGDWWNTSFAVTTQVQSAWLQVGSDISAISQSLCTSTSISPLRLCVHALGLCLGRKK